MVMLKEDKAASGESVLFQRFREAMAKESKDKSFQEAAVGGVRAAREAALAAYQKAWKKDPKVKFSAEEFSKDLLDRARAAIAENNAISQEEAAALIERTGLEAGLSAWAKKHFAALTKEARKQAKTGHDLLERQGRWGEILLGVGLLAYWGVFFFPNFWLSLASMFFVARWRRGSVSGRASDRVLVKISEHQGKITSMSFYQLIFRGRPVASA